MWTGGGVKENSKRTRNYEKRDPKAESLEKARHAINNAVRDGRMKKPSKCPNCGKSSPAVRIEYDHTTKGWRCSSCHKRGGAAPRKTK